MTVVPRPTGLVPEHYLSVSEQLRDNARRYGDKIALQPIDGGDGLSWRRLSDYANRIAHFLEKMRVRANDRIVVLGENSIENLILYYGIQAYGATYCTVNVEINRSHLNEVLARLDPNLVLWDEALALGGPDGGQDVAWLPFGRHDSGTTGLFAALAALPATAGVAPVNGPEDICVISLTSGTAAAPKAVLHSFCNYFAIAEHVRARWSLGTTDRVLEFRSISWASAHMLSLNPVLLTGGTLLFARRFSRRRLADWIGRYSPTVIVAVPTAINMLLEGAEAGKSGGMETGMGTVRFISCSTAPLMVEQHRRFEERYGVPLIQLYGMSEGGVVAANDPETRRIGSVGRAGLYQDLTIRGPGGVALGVGEIGEIETVSAQHAHAYLHADGTVEPIRGHALKTGDLGYLDRDGFLFITGRAKDVIIRGGVNIAPLEIDNALMSHPDIAEAATVGVPDAVYGEEVVSYVVRREGRTLDAETVMGHCADTLPEAKLPKDIVFTPEVPKNARGKIDRDALRARWLAEAPESEVRR
jgi:acyl-CoA synthetase (AMP-forming)/AMP-acid ligase II